MLTIKKIKHSLMAKSRERKYNEFLKLTSLNSESTILDVGVADKESSPYDNYLEKVYPHQSKITALSIQETFEFNKKYPMIDTVIYGGGVFPFPDKKFSAIHSNAVIEHVGNKENKIFFIKEMARCGLQFYFSTPAKEFLFEIHTNLPFLHWLPKSFFDYLLIKMGKGWASGNYMHLLTKAALHHLLQHSQIKNYQIITHRILGVPYQYVVFGSS
jgi:hypothetical protein